ncbi:hypothetical protein TNCV_4311491 [Trichonephila clavipes]|nr:hypothetical protein TNCV_4311491 [Trichonephila clavipes]
MYKNALKEDLIRVVEDLDGTVESTDTIAKVKTKIENSSTLESDPDFVKTLIQNCIDEREGIAKRKRATLEKQKIELAKLQLAQSQNFKPKIKENYPQYLEEKIKIALYAVIHLIAQETVRKRFKPKESNDHIHNRINVNTLKSQGEKQNSDEFTNLQYSCLFRLFVCFRFSSGLDEKGKKGRTAADSVQSGLAVVACSQSQKRLRAQAQLSETKKLKR